MSTRHLFVVTQGRTGSSMLTAALNSLPGVEIGGEDGGFWQDIYRAEKRLKERRDRVSIPGHVLSPGNPFYKLDFAKDEVLHDHWRSLALDLWWPAGHIDMIGPDGLPWASTAPWLIGQKEIRWDEGVPFLNWLQDVFGNDTLFLFLTRDVDEVARSSWWKTDSRARVKVYAKHAHLTSMYHEMSKQTGNVLLVDYSQLVLDDEGVAGPVWEKIATFLGLHWAEVIDDGVPGGWPMRVLRDRSSF